MPKAYYNENDPKAAKWLRNLIAAGLIMDGHVDDRSIADVRGSDLDGFVRCTFFAGIGGWDYALKLAGWAADRPVWSGSCPCQDFSNAGLRKGFEGDRDCWPEMRRLIEECRPDVFFGEQVDDSPEWYDRTAADLEALDYACGACVVPACAVGAIHQRDRLWFVADRSEARRKRLEPSPHSGEAGPWRMRGEADLLAIANAPFEPGDRWPQPLLRRMDDGIPGRLDIIGGFGNAIVPACAAEFISAFMDTKQ